MAIIGIQTDRNNPSFTTSDFVFWMPQYEKFLMTVEGMKYFNTLYKTANNKIFKSIYGSDWKLAMSYCIAHYLTLIANQLQTPAGNTLEGIAGGGVMKGVLASASVGGFSKTYDIDKTVVGEDDALFWNQTSYGAALMALLKTKAVASIMVVTSNGLYGTRYCKQSNNIVDLLDDDNAENWSYGIDISCTIAQGTCEIKFVNNGAAYAILTYNNIDIPDEAILDMYLNGTFRMTYNEETILQERQFKNEDVKINMKAFNITKRESNTLEIYIVNNKKTSDIFIGRFLMRG